MVEYSCKNRDNSYLVCYFIHIAFLGRRNMFKTNATEPMWNGLHCAIRVENFRYIKWCIHSL